MVGWVRWAMTVGPGRGGTNGHGSSLLGAGVLAFHGVSVVRDGNRGEGAGLRREGLDVVVLCRPSQFFPWWTF